jgi:sparc/osteonectin/cwcv/kazal-like domain-containing proteoglycan (testican)
MMKPILVVILSFISVCFGSIAKQDALLKELDALKKEHFKLYGYHELGDNELCKVLHCKPNEVCIVKHENAVCIKKKHLSLPKEKLPLWLQKEQEAAEHHISAKKPVHPGHGGSILKKKVAPHTPNAARKTYVRKETTKKSEHAKHVHLRQRHGEQDVVDCSDKELDAIGNRLRIWFGAVHHEEPQTVVHVAKHHISCPREVGWMFGRLDGDSDGVLTPDELSSVENDAREKCLKAFLDRCDDDGDDELNADEWCDCFQFSGREREEPPCHKARHKVDPHQLGVYLPRCDVDGFYRPVQCHEAACWCVDKLGREFDQSRVVQGRPDCGQYEENDDDLADIEQLKEAKQKQEI